MTDPLALFPDGPGACELCGRPRTLVRIQGAAVAVCACCGGGPVGADGRCRHQDPQRALPLERAP